jgi:hypothetical protein
MLLANGSVPEREHGVITRLDDGFIDHEKVERAAEVLGRNGYERAFGVAVWGIVYANRRLTDGFISVSAIRKYEISQQTVDVLVEVGLWAVAYAGYRIHDFHDWNPTAAEVKQRQSAERARKRQAYYRRKSDGYPTDSPTYSPADSPAGESAENPPDILRAHAKGAEGNGTPAVTKGLKGEGEHEREAKALVDARFDRFWEAYPRKVSKQDALKVFRQINPDHELLAVMLSSIAKCKASGAWSELRFVPHPDRWLRGKRWQDEVVPPAAKVQPPAPAWQAHCPHVPKCLILTACPEAWAWTKAQVSAETEVTA